MPYSKISIVGLQRSGTNYLEVLLRETFPDAAAIQIWNKHLFPSECDASYLEDCLVILISRHPAMWLQSCLVHNAADFYETHRSKLSGEDDVERLAIIYNQFYTEWIDFISRNDGTIVAHEDLVAGNCLDFISSLNGWLGATINNESINYFIKKVDNSIEFTKNDIDLLINRYCSIDRRDVERFFGFLSSELLGDLNYSFDEINFGDVKNIRTLTYKFCNEPHSLSDIDAEKVLAVAGQVFDNNVGVIKSIIRYSELRGDVRSQLHWSYRILFLVSRAIFTTEADWSFPAVISEKWQNLIDALYLSQELVILDGMYGEVYRNACPSKNLNPTAELNRFIMVAEGEISKAWSKYTGDYNEKYFDQELCIKLSKLLVELGKHEWAREILTKSCQIWPDQPSFYELLSNLLIHEGDMEEAEQAARQATRLAPQSAWNHFVLSQLLERRGQRQAALDEAGASIMLARNDPLYFQHRGRLLADANRPFDAEPDIRAALALTPDNAHCRFLLARILESQGQFDAALSEAQRTTICANADDWHCHHYGRLLFERGRLTEALESFRRAIELAPNCASHHSALGTVSEKLGQRGAALAEAEKAVACPDAGAPEFHRQGVLLMMAGRQAEAEASLRRAIQIKPDGWESHIELSTALTRQGRIDEAVEAARASIVNGATEARVLRQHGLLLARTGRAREAAGQLRLARQVGPRRLGWRLATARRFLVNQVLAVVSPVRPPGPRPGL